MNDIVDVLVYAAALDLYRVYNRREIILTERQVSAVLKVVAWEARPRLLALLGRLSYEASYIDASGADCLAFHLGSHEADVCHAALDENGER